MKTLFTGRVPPHVDHLTWFTAASFGGPDRFTAQLGFQDIIDVHRNLKITDQERERFVALYMEALDEAGVPDDERSTLGGARARRVRCPRSPAELVGAERRGLHPIRAVPHWDGPK